jgi:hypothetical protein
MAYLVIIRQSKMLDLEVHKLTMPGGTLSPMRPTPPRIRQGENSDFANMAKAPII